MSLNREQILSNPRLAGQVARYHTWPVLRQQSVGEHSWQCLRLYLQLWGELPSIVAEYFVWHDVGELVLGDLPFPVKARNPELKKLCDAIEVKALKDMGVDSIVLEEPYKSRAKFIDLLEMMEFGLCDVRMGNKWAQPIVDDIRASLTDLLVTFSFEDRRAAQEYVKRVYESLRIED